MHAFTHQTASHGCTVGNPSARDMNEHVIIIVTCAPLTPLSPLDFGRYHLTLHRPDSQARFKPRVERLEF